MLLLIVDHCWDQCDVVVGYATLHERNKFLCVCFPILRKDLELLREAEIWGPGVAPAVPNRREAGWVHVLQDASEHKTLFVACASCGRVGIPEGEPNRNLGS